MADDILLSKVHGLSDLELAGLLCLVSREHCLISTPPEALDELTEELQLIFTKTFGLKCVVVDCHAHTTLDDFAAAILTSKPQSRTPSPFQTRNSAEPSYFGARPGALTPLTSLSATSPGHPPPAMANVILARNLDQAPKAVQIQALELLRTRRIFTRTAVQAAPKQFLFVAALGAQSGGRAHVTPHLNDFLYLAHWHDPDLGFANLDEGFEATVGDGGSETGSMESVVKKSVNGDLRVEDDPLLSDVDIAALARLSQGVQIDVDVLRYQMNLISFLRMHRAVGGGVSPTATKHFEQLIKALAPLHQLDYATPGLVALALRKVYLHRIQIVEPGQERSMQWGSELEAVEALLEDIGPEEVMEEVLDMVATPL
ncbi:hypothetical protein D7B24_002904 [Verticillium nonalfalfae]|uniref:magnesium chelatase n=1 Tax=Verticillium nonalfalfae TaxID=1051616 RepID=A0A3M9XXL1_9PEZI|nr:uncharacterized protein D7B24_002904 [Verticillium nonalfalfae]RNJ52761.1 hypothetical protein D7B24_002904 [Verticillium nonalfalfae]